MKKCWASFYGIVIAIAASFFLNSFAWAQSDNTNFENSNDAKAVVETSSSNQNRKNLPKALTTSAQSPANNIATNDEANPKVNLHTTITGNQEQPRVIYILPWQSPASPEWEMGTLTSHNASVFGHVEREELRRVLESAGEFDEAVLPD